MLFVIEFLLMGCCFLFDDVCVLYVSFVMKVDIYCIVFLVVLGIMEVCLDGVYFEFV